MGRKALVVVLAMIAFFGGSSIFFTNWEQVYVMVPSYEEISQVTLRQISASIPKTSTTFTIINSPEPAEIPPTCTEHQLATVALQLPADHCQATYRAPWRNECSFSYASSCPEAVWIEEYYNNTSSGRRPKEQFTAIYVGCNKGMDAVNTLRMGAADATIDKFAWKQEFYGGAPGVEGGVCGQEKSEQFHVSSLPPNPSAIVHCLEAMPLTAEHLQQTARKFSWKEQLVIKNAALSSNDGVVGFGLSKVGNEKTSICNPGQANCQEVPMLRLDTYLESHQNVTLPNAMIDLLSIDVEGFDAEVLKGSNRTLQRTRYLEFEYNWKGPWSQHSLENVVQDMRKQGFVCYWPGAGGHIWRITDCWLAHYNLKFWSNVACVHVERHPTVARRMEELFLATLAQGESIKYVSRIKI